MKREKITLKSLQKLDEIGIIGTGKRLTAKDKKAFAKASAGLPEMKKYMDRTGASEQDVFAGLSFYGFQKVMKLVKEANKQGKKLIFFYESDDDLLCDKPSYKFE